MIVQKFAPWNVVLFPVTSADDIRDAKRVVQKTYFIIGIILHRTELENTKAISL